MLFLKKMRMKYFSLLAVGSALFYGTWVQASSIPSTSLVEQPGLVLMVDGKDPNASVAFEIMGRRFGSGLDFGFMLGDTFSSLGSGGRQNETLVFSGGTTVDFAVRSNGADKRVGTSDDQIFRLSDSAHFVNQYYSGAISPWKAVNPEQAETYYRNLTMLWDLDHNGSTDLKITLQARGSYDGMQFVAAATPVPLPAAVWLLGSGLISLLGIARRRKHAA